MNIKDFMEVVQYRITEGSPFGWNCYGANAYYLDSNELEQYGVTILFDTKSQEVYEMQAFDYVADRAYRWRNPDYAYRYVKEANERGVPANQAWDEVNFVDLEIEEDFLSKARSIVNGEEYDTRIQVELTLEDDKMFELMKIAHSLDITLNELVEQVLRDAIEQEKNK